MTKIVRGGETGSLDNLNSSQATFRTQIAALTDAVRQLGGAAEIGSGAVVNDPLSAPYVLYVNPYTGNDKFVGGNYSTSGTALERIELQRLECGYTEARPFKTINRAIIEAGIITAKSYYTQPLANNDLVSIILMPGASVIYNGTGASSVTEWAATKSPTTAELQEFNALATGGVLLPRGVSLCGLDLRKTIIRPNTVPAVADETGNADNRRTIFKVTGTGYYFGFTFMDKVGSTASHHLLHTFEFASSSELDEFYTKIQYAFGGANNTGGISNALAVTNNSEYEIVGPQPAPGSQTISTDTTASASPYIFNCSIRSNYGLCGIYADGSKVSGFRSMVVAQYTAVAMQRDLACWQKYNSGQNPRWNSAHFANYADYINTDPDDVRMHPSRRSFHVRAVNNAVIQEVSVFAIGQGVHHWTQNGGEITITNSNSNFGGCAAISEGYRSTSFAADTNWALSRIRVSANLTDLANNVRKLFLGTVSAVTSSSVTLTNALGESSTIAGVPDLLARDNYTLRTGSYLWVENPLGDDWRSTLTSSAWTTGSPAQLNISTALLDENGDPVGTNDDQTSKAIGKRVYVRRIVDTRTPIQRRFTLKLNTTDSLTRTPLRDYALQVISGSGSINYELPTASTITVSNATKAPTAGAGVTAVTEISLRRSNSSVTWTSGALYRKGEVVKRNDKHFTCVNENAASTFTATDWEESYVHMASAYNPEDFYKTDSPILIFDNDTSGLQNSTTLGYNFTTVWGTDPYIQAQYRGASDYRGVHLLLTALGFSGAEAHTILTPKPEASRDLDPSNSANMGNYTPSGAANALSNWPLEFRRPSVVRLFGHAWEWTGFLNYTKAIPAYQKELSAQNKFTYYFTNVDGGRVYATGFNEEGFQVTPRGLEDIATGTTLSVENLGASDITLDQPTELSNLTLNGTTIINDSLTINATTITFPTGFGASTTNAGIGEIASIAEIEQTSQATTDSGLNSAGSKFITAAGLKYWASWAKILTQRPSSTVLFVVPDNAVLSGTYNFNGTSATLTANPNRSGSAISTDPPFSRAKAVKFAQAVAYANGTSSTLETVEYYLANGPYWTSVSFNHIANVNGATAQFPGGATGTLADFTQASTAPANTNVKNLQDNLSAPVFATIVNSNRAPLINPSILNFSALPTLLNFNYGGYVTGIIWASVKATMLQTEIPDNLYGDMSTFRLAASGNLQSFIQNYVNATAAYTSGCQLDYFPGYSNITVASGTLSVQDCVFGARSPGTSIIGYYGISPTILIRGNCTINLSGIYLLGNTYLPSLTFSSGKPTAIGAGVLGMRNTQFLIASQEENSAARDCTIAFPNVETTYAPLSGVATYDLNLNRNCIHILDDNGHYGLMANRTSTTGTRGATMDAILGDMAPGSRIFTGGYNSYQSGFPNPNKHHGFAGIFGDLRSGTTEIGQGPVGITGNLDPLNFYRYASYHASLWQQAVTGTRLTYNVSLTYSPGTQVTAYTDSSDNALNIRSSVFFRGVDSDTAQIVGGTLEAVTVSGNTRYAFYG